LYKPLPNPVVVLREEFDDWAVLYNPDTATAIGLNPTAVTIWKLLDGRRSVVDVVNSITATFADPPPTAAAEIGELLDSLVDGGFLAVPDHG
jgi:SynChlorMet cassette protein ScmD